MTKKSPSCLWLFAALIIIPMAPLFLGMMSVSRSVIKANVANNAQNRTFFPESRPWLFQEEICTYGWFFWPEGTDVKIGRFKHSVVYRGTGPTVSPYMIFLTTLIFSACGIFIGGYGRYVLLSRSGKCAVLNRLSIAVVSITSVCFLLAGLCPWNVRYVQSVNGLKWNYQWVGTVHDYASCTGIALLLLYCVLHTILSWSDIGWVCRVYFLKCVLVVPPALYLWLKPSVFSRTEERPHGGHPDSKYEWIILGFMGIYMLPYSWWFLSHYFGWNVEPDEDVNGSGPSGKPKPGEHPAV